MVCKASVLNDWRGPMLECIYIYIYIYMHYTRSSSKTYLVYWYSGIYARLPRENLYINICIVWCSGIQGIYDQLTGEDLCWNAYIYIYVYICIALDLAVKLIWCSSIQGIYPQLTGVICLPSIYCTRSSSKTYLVYQYSRYLCSIDRGVCLPSIYILY